MFFVLFFFPPSSCAEGGTPYSIPFVDEYLQLSREYADLFLEDIIVRVALLSFQISFAKF